MGRADFPRNGRLVVHVWSDTISDDAPVGFTTIAPRTGKVDGERRHKFCIPGITFILFLGGLAPHAMTKARSTARGGGSCWLTPFADDLRQRSPDLPAHLSDRSRGRVRFWRRRWADEFGVEDCGRSGPVIVSGHGAPNAGFGRVAFLESIGAWSRIDAERVTPIYDMRVFGDDGRSRLDFSSFVNRQSSFVNLTSPIQLPYKDAHA